MYGNKMLIKILCVVFSVIYSVDAKHEEYKGYKVYNIKVTTEDQQETISLLKNDVIDFWRRPSLKYGVIGKVMVPPSHFHWFERKLQELEIERDVYIEDVYEFLLKEDKTSRSRRETNDDSVFNINRYHRYDDILNYLRTLPEKLAETSTTAELVEYGVTDENRPLVYLRLTRKSDAEKPIVVIEAGINPRDWITIPAALNVIQNILDESKFLEDLEWIIIPVLNPDGYEYTCSNLRLWQKSRSTTSHLGHICPGVHLNRNFDPDWLHFDSSSSPCSHLYGGPEPFSEVETQMIRSIIEKNGPRVKLFISLQNNGGYISFPWNFEKAASGMFREHLLLGLDMVEAMDEKYNLDVGSVIFDRASGTNIDYVRNSRILYTFNLDIVQSDNGVIIPEEDVSGIVNDVWKAIAVAANEMIRLNL